MLIVENQASCRYPSILEKKKATNTLRVVSAPSETGRMMVATAEENQKTGNLIAAAFYYRGAEFFTDASDPDKELLYDKFRDLFYAAFAEDQIERHSVPYEEASLPALRLAPAATPAKTR